MNHGLRPHSAVYQKGVVRALRKLFKGIIKTKDFKDIELVHARIPIVKAKHRRTGREVQLQVFSGIIPQQQFTLAYLSEFPLLRPLYLVLRVCLESRRLHVTYEGGIGSYTLLIMIVNALKHASGKQDYHDLGAQLLHVLDFYATSDLYRDGFSADPPHVFCKDREYLSSNADREKRANDPLMREIDAIPKLDLWKPYLLCLKDPANSSNDLGRKAYAIKHVQETFRLVRKRIILAMREWECEMVIEGQRLSKGGLLSPLLEANYRIYDQFRLRAKDFKQTIKKDKPSQQSQRSGMTASEMLQKMDEVEQRIARRKVEVEGA